MKVMMEVRVVDLVGEAVRLEPLSTEHIAGLARAGCDSEIWRYLPYGEVTTEERMGDLVDYWLRQAQTGLELPFVVVLKDDGRPIGCTRFLEIDRANRKVEIGGTWYATEFQRTRVNSECKYLLLRHAFEAWGCVRVQFKTDGRNLRSQKAIERLGAVQEGTLRSHMILLDGTVRDSVFYSVIEAEWPGVKARLEGMLRRKP